MKLVTAVQNIAHALNRIASALETKSSLQTKPFEPPMKQIESPKTSTPNATVTYYHSYSSVYVTAAEKEAFDKVYAAIIDKGISPKNHDKIMIDLSKKWPTLHSALTSLVIAKTEADKQRNNSYSKNRQHFK